MAQANLPKNFLLCPDYWFPDEALIGYSNYLDIQKLITTARTLD